MRRRGPWVCAVVLAFGIGTTDAAAQRLILHTAWQADGFGSLAESLRERLASQYAFDVDRATGDDAIMRQVRANPDNVGFVQRDQFVALLRQRPHEFDRLEFYGDIDACVVVITRKGALAQTLEQLAAPRADRKSTLDIGPAGGRVAATFALLGALEPALANLTLENRGGARAVARVLAGDTDAAMMILHAPFRAAELDRLLAEDAIDLVPFQSKRVAAAAVQQRAPYALKEIELGPSGWFAARRRYQTTCSPLGVVVNENADPRLSESVAQAMLYGTADFGREGILRTVQDTVLDFAARLYTMATDLGQRAIDLVVGGEEPATERDDGAASRPFRLDGRPSGPCGDGGM